MNEQSRDTRNIGYKRNRTKTTKHTQRRWATRTPLKHRKWTQLLATCVKTPAVVHAQVRNISRGVKDIFNSHIDNNIETDFFQRCLNFITSWGSMFLSQQLCYSQLHVYYLLDSMVFTVCRAVNLSNKLVGFAGSYLSCYTCCWCLPYASIWVHPRFFGGSLVAHIFNFLCCVVFLFCLSSSCVLYAQCFQRLWIFYSGLPLRVSRTFISYFHILSTSEFSCQPF